MTYLHCHKCDWQQDDYWSKSYNPLRFLLNWEDELLSDDLNALMPYGEGEQEPIPLREVIAREVERAATKIRNMQYRTMMERQAADWTCPNCHERALDED